MVMALLAELQVADEESPFPMVIVFSPEHAVEPKLVKTAHLGNVTVKKANKLLSFFT